MRMLLASVALVTAVSASGQVKDFDLSVQQLPPDYDGQSIAKVFAAVGTAPKGEFETTKEYDERLNPRHRRMVCVPASESND